MTRARLPEGQIAVTKKIAMGASTASSQRQGYCRNRISGSRIQSGREMGNKKKKTTTGMAATEIHQRCEAGDLAAGSAPRYQLIAMPATAMAIMEMAIHET